MTAKIEIISASAGSGKTHTLSERLNKAVAGGKVRPDAVVATTFTNRAAAELQERVRTSLLKSNRIDDAQILSTARIGTVNSVCGRLVSSFAFQLGLPVHLKILDENQAGLVLQRTLSRVVTLEEAEELQELKGRWRDLDWQADVGSIVDLARSNGIGADELKKCAAQSVKDYQDLLGGPPVKAAELTKRVIKAIEDLEAAADALEKPPGVTKKAVARAMAFLSRVRGGGMPAWSEWLWLCKIDAGAKVRDAAEKVRLAAQDHDRHPQMLKDLKRIVELVFSIAARGLLAYQEYKRELGLIDFVDQEVLALQLLGTKEVRERLKDEIDLVLVDEFQDTSPLQLAVFLALSGLSENNVWVGDQKQAIYGFRGTDPRLMDDAIEAILKDKKPLTLKHSHRSRPELVRLTSDIFQDSFKSQKIPKERVRLEPYEDSEPEGLGPIVERWVLAAKNKSEEAAAVAAGVKQLIEDPETLVRVKGQDKTKRIRPCDIAVLCRTNDECKAVADSLESIGVNAVIARPGLLKRPEARIVLSGLKLWFDPQDRLAAAELLRFCRFAGSAEDWLKEIIKAGELGGEIIDKIKAARKKFKFADLLQIFDRVVAAVEAREFCLAWGDSQKRLYNLDALRELVVAYRGAAEGGAQSTLGGLLAHFEQIGEEGLDEQAAVADESAVVVSTWHGAKGLEWPFVVIHSLDSKPKGSALGVKVVAPDEKFDLKNPLAGRWIRYWPYPYKGLAAKSALKDRLLDHPANQTAQEEEARERLRLLYVCWTRARDRLLLPARDGRLASGVLSLLDPPFDETSLTVRHLAPEADKERKVEPGEGYIPAGPGEHPPAFLNPSEMESAGKTGEPESIGEGFKVKGDPNPGHLGDAIHGFFAADADGLGDSDRRSIAAGLLARFEVTEALDADELLKASDALKAWVNRRWPDAGWHREIPMSYKLPGGGIVRGICDLALETDGGWVVIDHKSHQTAEYAARHAGQLQAYAEGIAKATSKPILGCFIHLPLLGMVVPVEK